MDEDLPGVGVVRRLLAHRLRELREQSDLTMDAVARELERSRPTLWKMEAGRPQAMYRGTDVSVLCRLYDTTPEETTLLTRLAAITRVKGWAGQLCDMLPPGFDLYQALEGEAAHVTRYEDRLVPALVQTEAYARAVLAWSGGCGRPTPDEETLDGLVAERMLRRESLTRWRRAPLGLDLVVAECVLRRPVGDERTMVGQLRRLVELSGLPDVSVRVLPTAAGLHDGVETGGFSLLRFPEGRGFPVVHVAGGVGSQQFWDTAPQIGDFAAAFDRIAAAALDPDRSRDHLTALAALAANPSAD